MESASINETRRESTDGNFASFDDEENRAYAPSTSNREAPIAIGNDMMAVARRIRERAQVLQDERKKAEAKRIVLLDLCQKRDAEKKTNEKQRKRMLQATNERNEVELEVIGVRESIDDCWKRAGVLEEKTREAEERIRKLDEQRAESTKSFYGPNLAKMETFLTVLETIVDSREKAVEAKRKRMDDLQTQLKESKMREEDILRETQETKEAIDREEEADDIVDDGSTGSESSNNRKSPTSAIARNDKEIVDLSSKVREAIEMVSDILHSAVCKMLHQDVFKVLNSAVINSSRSNDLTKITFYFPYYLLSTKQRSALRQKLRVVQKKYDDANKDMIFWQSKRMEKFTAKKL